MNAKARKNQQFLDNINSSNKRSKYQVSKGRQTNTRLERKDLDIDDKTLK